MDFFVCEIIIAGGGRCSTLASASASFLSAQLLLGEFGRPLRHFSQQHLSEGGPRVLLFLSQNLWYKYAMNFHVVTLFPDAFSSYLNESIIARAIKDKKIKVQFYNPRDYTKDKWRRIDQKPYAGGPGMVIQAEPVIKAIEIASSAIRRRGGKSKMKIVFLSPGGKQFDTTYAKNLSKKFTDIVLVSGRYEGIDARIKKVFKMEEISVGPYVLTGGELPAMILIDSLSRQVKGVLGNFDSLEESRISSHDVYTRPEVIAYKGKKYRVPKVLLSGNHAKIEDWKKSK